MRKVYLQFLTYSSILMFVSNCKKAQNLPYTAAPSASMTQNNYTAASSANMGYWLYTPENADTNLPLIVYLHGGRGSDLNLIVSRILPQFLKYGSVKSILVWKFVGSTDTVIDPTSS